MTSTQKSFLALYVVLLLLCIGLMVGAEFMSPTIRAQVLPIGADGFKLVLGAILGALSAMLGINKPQ